MGKFVREHTIIASLGERVDSALYEANGINVNEKGQPVLNAETMETSKPGVYAIGDGAGGAATIVLAIRDAQKAASHILGEAAKSEHVYDTDVARAAEKKGILVHSAEGKVSGETAAAGGCMAAAALAGVLCDQSDPAMPLNGQVLQGISGVTAGYEDTEYDALVAAGVTALECVGGRVSVIRGLTTRTKTGNAADTSTTS